jgi:hypothetical protein
MKIKAFGTNLRKEDTNTIKAMIKMVTLDIVDIYDLKSFEPNINHDDVVFLFGHRAQILCKDKQCIAKFEFPEIDKLSKEYGDPEERQLAKKKLLEIKNLFETSDFNKPVEKNVEVVDEKVYPDPTQLQVLEQAIKKRNIESWIGITKDGRKIKVTQEPEMNSADINITFTEFYNLRRFMDTFNIKETKIVYKPAANNTKNGH